MREIRPSGSAGGGAELNQLSLPRSGADVARSYSANLISLPISNPIYGRRQADEVCRMGTRLQDRVAGGFVREAPETAPGRGTPSSELYGWPRLEQPGSRSDGSSRVPRRTSCGCAAPVVPTGATLRR